MVPRRSETAPQLPARADAADIELTEGLTRYLSKLVTLRVISKRKNKIGSQAAGQVDAMSCKVAAEKVALARCWYRWVSLPIIMLGAGAKPVLAQATPEAERRAAEIQTRQEQRERLRQEQLLDRQRPEPSGSTIEMPTPAATRSDACTTIRSIEFASMTRYPAARFAPEIAAATGSCVRLEAINALLRAVTNAYVADGHVTSRAVVGPQDLRDGTLRVTVIEGELEAVEPAPGGPNRRSLAAAFPGLAGEILNLRDIEQGLDQLNRLASNDATIDIQPGRTEGTSRLVVANRRKDDRVRVELAADNSGQAATGRYQSTLSLEADNLLGTADFWSVYYSRDAMQRRARGTEGLGGFVSQPYGPATLSVSGGLYRYDSVIQGQNQRFASGGESWNLLVNLDRLLLRDAETKLVASASLRLTDTENSIRGIRLRTSSYRLVTAGLSGQLQQRVGQGLASLSLGVRRGIDALGANAAAAGPGGPRLEFTKLSATAAYQRRLTVRERDIFYAGQLVAQATDRPVFPAERFGLGGPGTVRGFLEDGLSGDNGFFTRHQLSRNLLEAGAAPGGWPATRLAGFVGYDAGLIIRDKRDRFERGMLHGVAGGLMLDCGRLSAELTLAAPIAAPSFVDADPVELTGSVRFRF